MWSDGRISIGQCDLVESWDNLSLSQKKNLNYRYQMGCECRVSKDCSFSIHTYLSLSHASVLEMPQETKQQSRFCSLAQTFFPFRLQKISRSVVNFHSDQRVSTATLTGEAEWVNKLIKNSSLLRSTPVTQCRVRLQEKTSACGLTGCWITA